MVYFVSKYALKLVKSVFVKNVKGINNLPRKGPFILAVNHASYLDPALVYAVVLDKVDRKIHSIAAKELFKRKLWDLIYRVWWESIPLNGAVEKAIRYLRKGEIVCIFPEGGRTATGKIGKPVGSGVAVMALESGAPVVPVYIKGSFDVWPKHRQLPNFEKVIEIRIGKPLRFKRIDGGLNKKAVDSVVNKVMVNIKKLLD